jgi:hypothetical protein
MRAFADLVFEEHPHWAHGFRTIAKMDFDNGYGVTVITGVGNSAYTTDDKPYELAVWNNGRITYETPITDDFVGYLTAEDVTAYMAKIQQLPTYTVEANS